MITRDDLRQMASKAPWKATRDTLRAQAVAAAKQRPERPQPAQQSPDAPPVDIEVDIRTQTECNTSENHWAKAKRAKWQRGRLMEAMEGRTLPALPVVVRFTRIAPGLLDEHDNLPSAFKHLTDLVAELYGVPDNDKRIRWVYGQRRERRYAVRVEVGAVKASVEPEELCG